jgi:hypothetical protein
MAPQQEGIYSMLHRETNKMDCVADLFASSLGGCWISRLVVLTSLVRPMFQISINLTVKNVKGKVLILLALLTFSSLMVRLERQC